MSDSQTLAYAALLIGALGVVLGVRAQTMQVRNQTDHFADDLLRQGKWAMWASIIQMLATVILVVRALLTGDA